MTTFMMQLITGIVWLVLIIVGWRQGRFNWLGLRVISCLGGNHAWASTTVARKLDALVGIIMCHFKFLNLFCL